MAEVEVLVLFVLLAILWISRDPKESPGWASLFMKGYDGTSGVSKATLFTHYSAEQNSIFLPSVCLCACLSVCLPVLLSPLYVSLCLPVYLSVSPPFLSVCLSVYLCLFHV